MMDIWDYVVLLAYFGILVGIGWRASRRQKDMAQYFVGGRRTGTLAIMTLWMASWVGGATILGTAEIPTLRIAGSYGSALPRLFWSA